MDSNISKYQKFETRVIKRTEIQNAEYNPRKISDGAKKKLRDNIKRVGLLDTIVVNKNTMNIVSGHQRVSILDSLERNKEYSLTVSIVDLSDKEEIEQNLFFNNSRAQGEYDVFALGELFEFNDIDLDLTGFELQDLGLLGVEVDLQCAFEEPEREEDKELLKLNNEIYNDAKSLRKAVASYTKDENKSNNDVFVVFTFSGDENKKAFLEKFGFSPNDKYIKGEVFEQMIREK